MSDIHDIPDNWRDDPLENTPPVRAKNFLRESGYEDASEARVKFLLAGRARNIIEARHLRQADVVSRIKAHDGTLGIRQPDVSRILKGNVSGYSVWRLIRVLNALGDDVRLVTSPAKAERATVDVVEEEAGVADNGTLTREGLSSCPNHPQ
ncbi:MAG: XRE family transcriptional regulator [Parvibaculaceae bacterium]|nr:XRE family transcriptional regulator [Parvibaculaceae bacterium]